MQKSQEACNVLPMKESQTLVIRGNKKEVVRLFVEMKACGVDGLYVVLLLLLVALVVSENPDLQLNYPDSYETHVAKLAVHFTPRRKMLTLVVLSCSLIYPALGLVYAKNVPFYVRLQHLVFALFLNAFAAIEYVQFNAPFASQVLVFVSLAPSLVTGLYQVAIEKAWVPGWMLEDLKE